MKPPNQLSQRDAGNYPSLGGRIHLVLTRPFRPACLPPTLALKLIVLVLTVSAPLIAARGGNDSGAAPRVSDEWEQAQDELLAVERTIATMPFPLRLREAVDRIGGTRRVEWMRSADFGHREYRRAQMVYAIVSPALKGKGYVVVFEARTLDNEDDEVEGAFVGFRTPLGGVYFADLRKHALAGRDSPRANRSSAPTPTGDAALAANASGWMPAREIERLSLTVALAEYPVSERAVKEVLGLPAFNATSDGRGARRSRRGVSHVGAERS